MRLHRSRVDNSAERLIVTGMIVSDRFLKAVAPIYQSKFMEIQYARTVADWCVEYFEEFGKAPGSHIKDVFKAKAKRMPDERKAELVSEFLSDISEEYEDGKKVNSKYLLKVAEDRFRSRSLQILAEDIQSKASQGKSADAAAAVESFKSIAVTESSKWVNPYTDVEAVREALDEDENEPMFKFTGAFGRLVNPMLSRESLIGIMAGEKKGKSWLLQEFAHLAYRWGNNVLYLSAGDMSRRQHIKRLHTRVTGRHYQQKYCGRILVPCLDCFKNQKDTCRLRHRTGAIGVTDLPDGEESDKLTIYKNTSASYRVCTHCMDAHPEKFKPDFWYFERKDVKPLTWREGLAAGRKLGRAVRGKEMYMMCYPTDSLSVDEITRQIDLIERRDGRLIDVVVIDYSDILAPSENVKEFRHQQNDIWKKLRSLSLARHNLIITATQADTGAYDQRSLRMKNFSEDKRKYAHVTAMLSLNQTDLEKKLKVCRIGCLVVREGEFHTDEEVTLLMSLEQGRPMVASF